MELNFEWNLKSDNAVIFEAPYIGDHAVYDGVDFPPTGGHK